MTRTFVLSCIGLTALVVNPFFACDDTPTFSYGELEMRSAIEGSWKLTSADPKAPIHELTLTIREKSGSIEQQHASRDGAVRSAAACGERSFVRTAGACADVSYMQLDITAGATRIAEAMFLIDSTVFRTGRLTFEIDGTTVHAEITPSGAASNVVEWRSYDSSSSATLVRAK